MPFSKQDALAFGVLAFQNATQHLTNNANMFNESNTQYSLAIPSVVRRGTPTSGGTQAYAVAYILVSDTQPWADATKRALDSDEFLALVRRFHA